MPNLWICPKPFTKKVVTFVVSNLISVLPHKKYENLRFEIETFSNLIHLDILSNNELEELPKRNIYSLTHKLIDLNAASNKLKSIGYLSENSF
jgi:hypothetical protein